MSVHLKAAVKRYPEDLSSTKIHPFSEVDSQIITEVIELFKKINFTDAVEILKRYKLQADDDIALDLLDLNTNTKQQASREEYDDQKGNYGKQSLQVPNNPLGGDVIRYINTCGRRIDLFLLIGFDLIDFEVQGQMKYTIKLNPTPELAKSIPFYANETLIFNNEEQRNIVAESLDSWFAEYRGQFLG